ncbi:hypothetical protein OE88DRAFT_650179 [Heliocybe sulcata]|uniref:Uncharacterized protein n=1 Tax=Heliocybe sulcata TaxID=5364 RepID=A0A5C3NEF7_9AGAM|nr:hypothetical protein OE88DRAFT_650179 [Heliocybe sulcata]
MENWNSGSGGGITEIFWPSSMRGPSFQLDTRHIVLIWIWTLPCTGAVTPSSHTVSLQTPAKAETLMAKDKSEKKDKKRRESQAVEEVEADVAVTSMQDVEMEPVDAESVKVSSLALKHLHV